MSINRRAQMLGVGVLVGAVLAAVFMFPASKAPTPVRESQQGATSADTSRRTVAPQAPIAESRFARSQRRRRSSPVNPAATKAAEARCLAQAGGFVAFQYGSETRRPLVEVTDIYGVGDPETGAGDSLIIEGTARLTNREPRVWHCALAAFDRDRVGGPAVTVLETWPTIPITWQATHAVHEEARIRCLEAATAAWPGPSVYPEPLMRRAGDTLVVTGSFPPSVDGVSREYRCDALLAPNGGIVVTIAEASQ